MEKQEILKSLETIANNPPNISYDEYWEKINKLAEKEQKAFSDENKKLKMSEEQFHRIFTI